jgi:alanine racemase
VSRAEALINLDAIRGNVATLKRATPAEVMAVVKADGYGHGLLPVARAALAGGATWLGTAIIDEALLLRAAGIPVPILAWLWSPSESVAVAEAIRAGVDLSVSSTWALDTVLAAARDAGQRANVHLKIETGLSRNAAYIDDWPISSPPRPRQRRAVRSPRSACGATSHMPMILGTQLLPGSWNGSARASRSPSGPDCGRGCAI